MIDPISPKVFNASSISVLVSIGIHALVLGVALPSLSMFSQKDQTRQRNVGLIELTPMEQTRLPDLSASLPNIPSLSDPSQIDASLPSNPALDSSVSNAIPSGIDSLPPPPSLPSLSYNNNLPLSAFNPRSFLPPPPPNSLPIAPPLPLSLPPSLPSPSQTNPSIDAQRPVFSSPQPPIPIDDLINQAAQLRKPFLIPPETSTGTQSDVARNWQQQPPVSAANSPAAIQEQRLRKLALDSIQRSESLQEDKTNTTNDEAMRNNVRWISKVGEIEPQEVSLLGTYPKDACFRKLEGSTIYGVMVNGAGKVITIPELIKSAGYPILNQQASQDIQSRSFPNPSGNPKPYRVQVDFKYNSKICPTVMVPPPGTTPIPVPAPTPEVSTPTPTVTPVAPSQTPEAIQTPVPQQTPEVSTPTPSATPVAPSQTPEVTQTPIPQQTPESSTIAPAAPRKTPTSETPQSSTEGKISPSEAPSQ